MRIVIENSFCKITEYEYEVVQLLTEALTYTDNEVQQEINRVKNSLRYAQLRGNRAEIYRCSSRLKFLGTKLTVCLFKDLKFPTGLLFLVEQVLNDNNVKFSLQDVRDFPKKILDLPWKNGNRFPPRYYQEEMVQLGKKYCRGVFVAAVGSGKSLVMNKLIKEIGVPTLVITPSSDLKTQLIDSLSEVFGSKFVENLDSKAVSASEAGKKVLKPIRVATIQTLAALLNKGRLTTALNGINAVCVDEIHHAGSESYVSMLPHFEHIYYRFGFSGTFLRNDSRTLEMWAFLSNVLYRYPAYKAIEEGFLTPLRVLIHDVPGIVKKNYAEEYNRNYCGDVDGGEISALQSKILQIVSDISKEKQILILVKQKEASGALIHEMLKQHGIDSTYISGDSKKSDVKTALKAFNSKLVRILIGSTIIGEGIDIRSTDHLIMAQGGKSEIVITQATGRAVRLFEGKTEAVLHDFNFENTKYLQKHLVKRIDIYEKNFAAKILIT